MQTHLLFLFLKKHTATKTSATSTKSVQTTETTTTVEPPLSRDLSDSLSSSGLRGWVGAVVTSLNVLPVCGSLSVVVSRLFCVVLDSIPGLDAVVGLFVGFVVE